MIGEPSWGPDGLVPVVVQDEADGRVLMVAYTDVEALALTEATAQLHFYSRSRQTLWRKGATSGNTLQVVALDLDCDRDAILATVRPAGPACHRGTRSCFDPAPEGGPAGEPEGAGAVDAASASIEPPTEIAVTYPEPEGFDLPAGAPGGVEEGGRGRGLDEESLEGIRRTGRRRQGLGGRYLGHPIAAGEDDRAIADVFEVGLSGIETDEAR